MRQLKQLFANHPEHYIPEMQTLTDEDWLRATRLSTLDSEHDTRRALGDVRKAAKDKFAQTLGKALYAYTRAVGDKAPDSILALAPYFAGSFDSAALQRYDIGLADKTVFGGPTVRIRERAPIDAYYDSRSEVFAHSNGSIGFASGVAPVAWTPDFYDRLRTANKAYAEANQGTRPTKQAQAYPYFNPPLDAPLLEMLRRFNREK